MEVANIEGKHVRLNDNVTIIVSIILYMVSIISSTMCYFHIRYFHVTYYHRCYTLASIQKTLCNYVGNAILLFEFNSIREQVWLSFSRCANNLLVSSSLPSWIAKKCCIHNPHASLISLFPLISLACSCKYFVVLNY